MLTTRINGDGAQLKWRKASYSNAGNNCVEIAPYGSGIAIRDSKNPDRPHLAVSATVFGAFIAGIKEDLHR